MEKCPFCKSEDIYFSKKRKIFVCENCDKTFSEQQLSCDQVLTSTSISSGLKLFFSYGHDKNRPLVERIKHDLEKRGHHIWIDTSEIKAGNHWRDDILNGVLNATSIIAFLSEHSTRDPGVCLDELKIAVCVKGASIKTVLLEPENRVRPPMTLSDIQWLDMSRWDEIRCLSKEDFEQWYQAKFAELCRVIESSSSMELGGDIHFLKEKLSPYLNSEKEYQLLSKEFHGRKWLEHYIDSWRISTSSKALVLYGKPGCGKSAFSVNYSHYNPDVYGCFLCEWNREHSINPNRLIRTMAFRLATKLPDYRSMLLRQLSQDNIHLDEMGDDALFDFLLSYPLNHLVDGDRQVGLIIVDGLDEAEVNGSNPLSAMFSKCVEQTPRWIRFLFTSRPERNVRQYFQAYESVDLVKDMPEGYNDIMAFLVRTLSEELKLISNKLEVLNRICQLSEGTFLYAELLVQDIRNGIMNLKDIQCFPKGLSAFYRISMERKFKVHNHFSEIRNLIELLTVADTIPELLIIDICGYSQYQYLLHLDQLGAWVSRQKENGLFTIGFSHKSLADWYTDVSQSGDFYADKKAGALSLARHCRVEIERGSAAVEKKYPETLVQFMKSHVGAFYVTSEQYADLESFLLTRQEELSPYWLVWSQFPQNWNHEILLSFFWQSPCRDQFLYRLQREGNTKFLLWIFDRAKETYGIESLGRNLISVYMDVVHMSGNYSAAVDLANQYLCGYPPHEIFEDEFLSMLNVRKIHHSMFFKPVQMLIDEALSLFAQNTDRFPAVSNELLFLIGGNLGVLSGNWDFAKKWLDLSERYAIDHGLESFRARNARKIADYYCQLGDYEKGVQLILAHLPAHQIINGRYENYLIGALGNLYLCMGREDDALQCFDAVLKFSAASGITGWTAHANLGIANVNFKLGNLKEAADFASRANSSYRQIQQEWGLIMSGALLAACNERMNATPIHIACAEYIERARIMQYGSCKSSIEDLCYGQSNYLTLYFL